MVNITFLKNAISTVGQLPKINAQAPDFILVQKDLSEVTLDHFQGKKKVLNIFPSLDTGVCATSVKQFYSRLNEVEEVVVLNISKDLPFAQGRFCEAEGLDNVVALSGFRSTFGKDYGVDMIDGPLTNLYSRVVIILNENNEVLYTEQVPEITQEPDYEKALEVLTR